MRGSNCPLPSPQPGIEEAVAHVCRLGLSGMIRRLEGEVDETFRLDTKDGTPFLVKLAQTGEAEEAVTFQTGLLDHLQLAAPRLPLPRLRQTADGAHYLIPEVGPLEGRIIRVISFLPGEPLRIVRSTRLLREQIGRILAVLGRALRDYDHPVRGTGGTCDASRQAPGNLSGVTTDLVFCLL
jgi:Ser/Thr protein kinase RdoA (MazF antagonist)